LYQFSICSNLEYLFSALKNFYCWIDIRISTFAQNSYPTGYWCYILLYSLSHMVCSNQIWIKKFLFFHLEPKQRILFSEKVTAVFFPYQCSVKTSKSSIFYHYCSPLEIRAFIFEQKNFFKKTLCCTYSCFLRFYSNFRKNTSSLKLRNKYLNLPSMIHISWGERKIVEPLLSKFLWLFILYIYFKIMTFNKITNNIINIVW